MYHMYNISLDCQQIILFKLKNWQFFGFFGFIDGGLCPFVDQILWYSDVMIRTI